MSILANFGESLVQPFIAVGQGMVEVIPGIVGAIVVLAVGWLIAVLVGKFVRLVLEKARLDQYVLHKMNMGKVMGKFHISEFIGLITKWYIFVLFLPSAAGLIKLSALSAFLVVVALWVPRVIVAVLIAFLGFFAANYVCAVVAATKAKHARMIGDVLRVLIIVFVSLIALDQIGIDVSLAENLVLIVFAGVMLAFGIGFGLAMQDDAKKVLKGLKKR